MEEVHALPQDGNTYELVHGELLVTPPPFDNHETIGARLTRILDPYVERQGLGFVYRPHAVFRIGAEVQLEPDLMVRQQHPNPRNVDKDWETAPLPVLVVEILSASTRRRDAGVKRDVYVNEARIPEYWIVDGGNRTIRLLRPDGTDMTVIDRMTWAPVGTSEPLVFDLDQVFG